MFTRLIVRSLPIIAAVALSLTGMQAFAATATINPIQDNTVAEELPDNSSGACDSIFSGNTDVPAARRAFMQFDVAGAIPPGSIINSVTLSMAVTRGSNHVDSTFTLHPVNAAWVEVQKVVVLVAAVRVNLLRVVSPGTRSQVLARLAVAH